MFIEYKIRFEQGGVTVTQIVEPDGSMQIPAGDSDGSKSKVVKQNRLPRVSASTSGGGGTDPAHVGAGGTDPGHVGGGGTDPGHVGAGGTHPSHEAAGGTDPAHVGNRFAASGTVIIFGPVVINCCPAAPAASESEDEEKEK